MIRAMGYVNVVLGAARQLMPTQEGASKGHKSFGECPLPVDE